MTQSTIWELTLATIIGSSFTLLGIIVNNLLQNNTERIKSKRQERNEERNRVLIAKKELVNDIRQIHLLLSFIKDNHTLTSSYIDSFVNLSPEEYSRLYKDSFEKIHNLKWLVDLNFMDKHDKIEKLDGLMNIYWGNQHNLLSVDVNKDNKLYSRLQEKIIEVSAEISSEVSMLMLFFVKTVNSLK